MDYRASEFTHMRFNPQPLPSKANLLSEFPVFDMYKVFKVKVEGLSTDMILRYIMYAFDPQSPMASINDSLQRRVEAAMMAGFEATINGFSPIVEKMIKSLVPEVNHMVIQFCLLINESDYAILVTYQDALRKQLQKMMDSTEDTDHRVLIQNTNTLRAEITKIQESILNNNIDYFLSRSLTQFADSEQLELSPEYFATLTQEWDNISRYYKKKEETE
jgi:hypothetical protein